MRRSLRGLLVLLLVATAVSAAPARAESGHRAKAVGNAPPAIDITAIEADNALRRVRVTLVVPGLTHEGTFTFGYERPLYDGMAIVVRHRTHRVTRQAWHCNEETCARVACPGIHIRWSLAAHYVRASIPQSCYPFEVPKAWNFIGLSDLGDDYDSEYTKLRLRRG